MKKIIDYKLFEIKLDIKNDIDGILIELVDNGYFIEVKMDKYIGLSIRNRIQVSNDESSISIVIKNTKTYNSNDIEDYVLTILDYLKVKFTDRLEEKFYTGMQDKDMISAEYGRWNTYSEFPNDLYIRQFAVCIKKY
jgi:hypothetical protein